MCQVTTQAAEIGLQVPCPKCGEESGIRLHLADGGFTCSECDGEWTCEDVEALIRRWTRVIAWVRSMPTQAEVDAA